VTKTLAAPPVEPRVYPAGRAVLLFGVGPASLATRRFTVEGRRVQGVRLGRLALLVSYVDVAAYSADELERKRTDRDFLRTEARVHERAVERASVHAAVAPARLLSAFEHPAALEAYARAQYARWCRALPRLGDKREVVVQIFAGPHAPPAREPYLLRVTPYVARTARNWQPKCERRFEEHVRSLASACAAVASAARRIALPAKRGALYSAAFLVDAPGADALRGALADRSAAGVALGITAYLEGPRAPFSFVA